MEIETTHLQLKAFSAEQLLALIESVERFAECFGIPAAEGLRDGFLSDDVSSDWLARLRASSGVDPWQHGFAVIHRERRLQSQGEAGRVGGRAVHAVSTLAGVRGRVEGS